MNFWRVLCGLLGAVQRSDGIASLGHDLEIKPVMYVIIALFIVKYVIGAIG